ncbi:hypothetical protein KVV02_003292 [Mortierella alpina]|uniref:Uncharacterized protein n=1 Tax=Mortierella alpina TaxID=64518 RepID=A0A9P8A8Q5_MORAP|nr:hypothetical protein KVV02_003292 [Mortierella alpina]
MGRLQSLPGTDSTSELLGFYGIAHHAPSRHPAAPKDAEYPLKAVAPVKASSSSSPSKASAAPGGASRHYLDFTELPARYRHPQLTQAEIEAVEAGGATLIY